MILTVSTKGTPGASISGQLEAAGASSSRRAIAREELLSEKAVIFVQILMERSKYSRKFDDPAKNVEPQSEEEHDFHNQVLNSFYVQDLVNIVESSNISRSTLRLGAFRE